MNHGERRIVRLELAYQESLANNAALQRKVDKLQEAATRGNQPPQGSGGGGSWIGYTTSTIPATTGNNSTTGTVKLCKLVKASTPANTYTWTDLGLADVPVVNGTGDPSGAAAGKRCGGTFEASSGVRVMTWFNCSTGTDATPATASAVTTQSGTPMTTQSGQQVGTQ